MKKNHQTCLPESISLYKCLILINCLFCTISLSAKTSLTGDSIPFEYDFNKKGIVINAILNDTIPIKVFFDTGTYGLIITDSLNIYNESDESSKSLQIGNNKVKYYCYPKGLLDHISYRNPIFSWFGVNAIVGWDFFDNKTIEISYKHKYIKEIELKNDFMGYQKLKMKKEQNKWGIEGVFILQNKRIEEYVMMDTGNTSTLTFNDYIKEKYNIETFNAQQGKTSTITGGEKRWVTPSDSIIMGHFFVVDHKVAFRDVERRSPFAGILGNLFWENYDLILDFKNNVCYLKRNE